MTTKKLNYLDMKNILTASTLFAILVMLFALYFRNTEDELHQRLKIVLSGLITIDKKHQIHNPRIAVGYGSCKDIVFNGNAVIKCDHLSTNNVVENINSYEDLYNSYSYFFRHGAAAERFTPNSTLFTEILMKVSNLESARINVGGNAASMANRFALEGCAVLLATSATSVFKKRFPPNVNLIGEVTDYDDIHLIFEYKTNEKCGLFTAPRANRFILHHDYHNPRISSLNSFGLQLKQFRPHLLVISGLQMMDNYPVSKSFIEERLFSISKQIKTQSDITKIHFEMASISKKDMLLRIFDLVVPFVDSLGMNEQELANIYSLLKDKTVTLAVDSNPKISKTLDMMRQIFSYLQEARNKTDCSRPLSRLHVHTLAYQVIMILNKSGWKNTHIAAAKASLVANTYVCGTKEVNIDDSMLVMDESFSISSLPGSRRVYLDNQKPVACWSENLYYICIAPNLVCTNAKQTAGCGDNISAAGLDPTYLRGHCAVRSNLCILNRQVHTDAVLMPRFGERSPGGCSHLRLV
ncbi:hypothetical protein PGB90_002195 [Kerria lacca]